MKNIIVAGLLLIAMSFFSGCSTKMSKDAVVAHNIPVVSQYQSNVYVNAIGNSDLSDEDFTQAIKESIKESSLFKEITADKTSNYILEVAIVTLNKPSFGFTFTVEVEVSWSLKNSSNDEIVMRKVIKTSSTKTVSDAFAAVERIKIAMESAINKNISLGLTDISKLQLK